MYGKIQIKYTPYMCIFVPRQLYFTGYEVVNSLQMANLLTYCAHLHMNV